MAEETANTAPGSATAAPAASGPVPVGAVRDLDRGQLGDARGGVWGWLMQRVTAVVLIVGLGTHLVATHILNIGDLSYDNIAARLAGAFFIIIDVGLLAAAIFHGLNGLRMVLLDYFWNARRQRLVFTWLLWAFGTAFFIFGLWALWPWIT
jgi:succinate dehydrogenase cytochrome b556 subunit